MRNLVLLVASWFSRSKNPGYGDGCVSVDDETYSISLFPSRVYSFRREFHRLTVCGACCARRIDHVCFGLPLTSTPVKLVKQDNRFLPDKETRTYVRWFSRFSRFRTIFVGYLYRTVVVIDILILSVHVVNRVESEKI